MIIMNKLTLFLMREVEDMYLTQSEMEVMKTFWQCNRPMTLNDLIEANTNKSWKDRSGFSLIKNLIKKGLLREDGFVHSGKTIARTFIPTISFTDFMIDQLSSYDGKIAVPKLFAHLLGDYHIDSNDISELDKIIADKKRELNNR